MPEATYRYCAFCGEKAIGSNTPVKPTDPANPEDPPGSGWHKHAGPSYGFGFFDEDFYCSDECLNRRVINKEEPPRLLLQFERNWKPRRPDKEAKAANPKPTPKTKQDAIERSELAESILSSAEETIAALEEALEKAAQQEQEYIYAVETLTRTIESLQAEKDRDVVKYGDRETEQIRTEAYPEQDEQ